MAAQPFGLSETPQKDDLTVRLIARFKDLISRGILVAGVRFPPERELARRFGVNRSSLRQALKALEIMGVVTQRVGDGTYFNAAPAAIMSEPVDFLLLLGAISHDELFDLRLLVEPALAARAAERATTARPGRPPGGFGGHAQESVQPTSFPATRPCVSRPDL